MGTENPQIKVNKSDETLTKMFLEKLHKNNLINDEEESKKIISFMINELKDVPINIRCFFLETLANEKKLFDEFDSEFFIRIIRHLRLLGEQKREKHAIGANIIVFPDSPSAGRAGTDSAIPYSTKDKKLPIDIDMLSFFKGNEDLELAYRYINSQNAFFAYQYSKQNNVCKFIGIKEFTEKDSVFNNMKKVCSGNNIGFSLQEGKSCIRIFYGGKHIVDYALNEASGAWLARFTKKIHELIERLKLSDNDAQVLTSQIIQLAYSGNGAMIIVTNDLEQFANNHTGIDIDLPLGEQSTERNFISYASIDGAVIIEHKQNSTAKIKKCGVIISPSVRPSEEYDSLINKSNSGSRHEKAASYACEHPNDFVIVVSENKTISFLNGSEPIYWRDRDCQINEADNLGE